MAVQCAVGAGRGRLIRQCPAECLVLFRMTLLLWLCGGSLLLSAIGVYGIVTQAAAERLRELAIRLALGADPGALTLSFVRSAMVTGAAGVAIGAVPSLTLARLLESMLYGVPSADAMSLSVAGFVLLGVTGVAAWWPALRAARTSVARALDG